MCKENFTSFSSEAEIMWIILYSIFAAGMNLGPSYLLGFISFVVPLFAILVKIQYLGISVIFLFFTAVFMDILTILRVEPRISGGALARDHFKLFRAILMVNVVICIFLADHPSLWNKKFSKTFNHGISLMDSGILGFLFNAAFTRKRETVTFVGRKDIFLIIAGFVRLFVIRFLNYDVDPAEYGIHLNFYFILGILDILLNIYKSLFQFPYLFDTTVGFAILFAHKRLFSPEMILNTDRSTFLLQNKEGFNSLINYFAFMLIVADFGYFYRKTIYKFLLTFTYSLLFLINYKFFLIKDILKNSEQKEMSRLLFYKTFLNDTNIYVSRRLCNLNFINWALYMNFLTFLFTFILSHMFPRMVDNNSLVDFISGNMMLIFIVSNLCIIIAKLKFNGRYNPLLVNLCYLFFNFVIIPTIKSVLSLKVLIKRKIKK